VGGEILLGHKEKSGCKKQNCEYIRVPKAQNFPDSRFLDTKNLQISDDPMDRCLVKYSTITMLTTIVTCTSRNRHEVCKLNNN
jgi:hypothetical protein